MKGLLSALFLGGAAYLLYRQMAPVGGAVVTEPPSGGADPGGVVLTPGGGAVATGTTVELLNQAAGAGPLTADEWGWYYQQLRGVAAPDPLAVWPLQDRSYRMTAQEWFDGARNHGVSGLRTNYRVRR